MNDIYKYIHHLTKCPFEFRRPSLYTEVGGINTDALMLDVLRDINPELHHTNFLKTNEEYMTYSRNHIISLHIASWFFSLDVFKMKTELSELILDFSFNQLSVLSDFVEGDLWLEDEDRSEEFVRLALFSCGIVPDGETEIQAKDRMDALSTLKRNNVLSESKAAFDRIMDIRRKMAEKKAKEAANVYGRE